MIDRGIRQQMFAHLAVFYSGRDALNLLDFGPELEKDDLQEIVEDLLSIPEEERLEEIQERIMGIMGSDEFSGISEIHPAWLVEILSKESPRIIGVILRYLPSIHVRYILNHLPRRLTTALPNVVDAFAVPTPLLRLIKRTFERHFIPMHVSRNISEFTFQNLYYLKAEELEILIRDLGIQELAMAIDGAPPRTLNVLLNRLSIKEATALRDRINSLKGVDAGLKKDARYSILEMSLEEMDAPTLLLEFGLIALAKSFKSDDMAILPLLRQKLSPRLGYLLKRYVELHAIRPSNVLELRQELVLRRIAELSKAGVLNEYWSRFFIPQDETKAFKVEDGGDTAFTSAEGDSPIIRH